MRRWIAAVVIAITFSGPVLAQGKSKLVEETWDAAYLEGGKAGTVHVTTDEIEQGGMKFFRTTMDLYLKAKRFNQVIELRFQIGNDETADGAVLGNFSRQKVGKTEDRTILGIVKGKQIEFLLNGEPGKLASNPWDDKVVSLRRQQTILKDKRIKPGDKFSFSTFEPSVNMVIQVDVKVLDYEVVDVPGSKSKQKLLRVEMSPEKLEGVMLPTLIQWVAADHMPVRQDTEIPGLGKLTLVRTTREIALTPGAESLLTDIGISQLILLNRKVLKPYETKASVFRITVRGDEDAASAFAQDPRQVIRAATKGSTFEMQVTATKGPKKGAPAAKAGDEFIQSSYFITSDDPKVKELARKAVGKETDPWQKALLIEKWVNSHMRSTNDEALAPASRVAKTLEGDCTEYAMLMAAMCRAEGVPSKTAIGLIYADTKNGPAMAFHMWTEVWVQDQWVPLDATLGRGYVGAMHLKVTDHSWHDMRSQTPLLPLSRVLGKLQIELVETK
jgi:transglutaminase-like putative cysteine protease